MRGGSHSFKYLRLESYEDSLNNLEVRRNDAQQLLLETPEAKVSDGLREQYVLRYMLNVEPRGSGSLINIQEFSDPRKYALKIKVPGSDESTIVHVDLLETFNWLIGLTVKRLDAPETFTAAFFRDSQKRLKLKGALKKDPEGRYWFRAVSGVMPDQREALVVWRTLTGKPEEENVVLEEWLSQKEFFAKGSRPALIYVNGGNNLENLKASEERWNVRLIEDEFIRLMFESERS